MNKYTDEGQSLKSKVLSNDHLFLPGIWWLWSGIFEELLRRLSTLASPSMSSQNSRNLTIKSLDLNHTIPNDDLQEIPPIKKQCHDAFLSVSIKNSLNRALQKFLPKHSEKVVQLFDFLLKLRCRFSNNKINLWLFA